MKKITLEFLISLKEILDSWREMYNNIDRDYMHGDEAREYSIMITIKEETLLENGKRYFGDISLKEIESRLDEEIKRINKQKKDNYFDQAITKSIDDEIKNRSIKKQRINSSCENAIATLERKISNPEGYMADTLWESRKMDNKRKKAMVDLDDARNTHQNCEDKTSYTLKGN